MIIDEFGHLIGLEAKVKDDLGYELRISVQKSAFSSSAKDGVRVVLNFADKDMKSITWNFVDDGYISFSGWLGKDPLPDFASKHNLTSVQKDALAVSEFERLIMPLKGRLEEVDKQKQIAAAEAELEKEREKERDDYEPITREQRLVNQTKYNRLAPLAAKAKNGRLELPNGQVLEFLPEAGESRHRNILVINEADGTYVVIDEEGHRLAIDLE